MTTNERRSQAKEHAVPWHALREDEVMQKLQSSLQGLTEDEAAERLEEYGKNALPAHLPPTLLRIFLRQFASPLIYVLLAAGIISLVLAEFTDATFIFLVILLNAVIGTFQEWQAEKSASSLQELLKIYARIRRGGDERTVPSEDLVPGDIVLLESGNRIPADIRLLRAQSLTVDESLLTGESHAIEKRPGVLAAKIPVADRANMAFAGSTVMGGRGTGVVVATGSLTQIGLIAETVSTTEMGRPPLVIRMEEFSRKISIAVLAAAALVGLIVLLQGMAFFDVFFLAVALAVSAIPEGLPVAMTVALSIATSRMAKRNVIVRQLAAVESLGSCTAIASDKTGTLTVNQQTVRTILLPSGRRFSVTGAGYAGEGEVSAEDGRDGGESAWKQVERLATAAVLCNEGSLLRKDGEWSHQGDAMDVALLALGYKAGLDVPAVRQAISLEAERPFESERRYAAVWYREEEDVRVAVKGAIEVLLPFCETMATEEGSVPIDPSHVEAQLLDLSESGYRVLAIAEGRASAVPGSEEDPDIPPLELLGLAGFIDPIRPDVPEAIDRAHRAGVNVVMITGDHPATAFAIARELQIADAPEEVTTGAELEAIGPPDLPEFLTRVRQKKVFARVTPLQKLHIVEALRTAGAFVAVTGDGVNDAPALRTANIGVAMGSGTDVAKDTASMIVTDDNFSSIVAGIEEGRYAYDNVRKVTYLLISTGFSEVVLFMAALIAGLPIPLVAVQLLWLNLVTNGIQGAALAFEAGEPGAMQRPPRKPGEGIFNDLMIKQTLVSGIVIAFVAFGLWYWLLHNGWAEAEARNLVILLMVLLENFHVFNCRSEYRSLFRIPISNNYFLIGGVIAAQGIHILSMYIPFLQETLGVAPVRLGEWILLALLASIILIVMEIFKRVRGYRSPHPQEAVRAR
ncbi:MAG: HAD-IC family P-type ATPase [Methanomicrobiaceae archaeon]|uniref:Cation-transporting atpase n=1 Tax=hydrocarbon metagenome TaxID=938273 RepID=A0A0W8FHI0_9ZZZZ|nr:HAD-IC family P-type ATPase [Methanomicrobiaceae archaeon]MDD5420370.1 HAD-IC family P-type ATPase [Methanomicrobiaceae archaeon]